MLTPRQFKIFWWVTMVLAIVTFITIAFVTGHFVAKYW